MDSPALTRMRPPKLSLDLLRPLVTRPQRQANKRGATYAENQIALGQTDSLTKYDLTGGAGFRVKKDRNIAVLSFV